MIVVLKLCQWEKIIPITLLFVDEYLEVLFKLLIYLLCLSI